MDNTLISKFNLIQIENVLTQDTKTQLSKLDYVHTQIISNDILHDFMYDLLQTNETSIQCFKCLLVSTCQLAHSFDGLFSCFANRISTITKSQTISSNNMGFVDVRGCRTEIIYGTQFQYKIDKIKLIFIYCGVFNRTPTPHNLFSIFSTIP